jgi:hypothetical protein
MKKILLITIITFFVNNIFSQIKLESGDFQFLLDAKKICVEYDYSSMTVNKFNNENDFIVNEVGRLKSEERVEKWKSNWAFEKSALNTAFRDRLTAEFGRKYGILFEVDGLKDCRYKFKVKILHYTFGSFLDCDYVDLKIDIVESNSEKSVCLLNIKHACASQPGQTTKPNSSYSMATAASMIASLARKKIQR